MRHLFCRSVLVCLSLLLASVSPFSAQATESAYFPTGVGSKWTYNTEQWTMTGSTQALISGTEEVEVLSNGSFKSFISLINNNTVTSYSTYANQGQAILVSGSQITIVIKDTPIIPGVSYWTETTGINTYSPAQLIFPSTTVSGTHETSDSTETTNITGISHYTAPVIMDVPIPLAINTSQQHVDIVVGVIESVSVPVGTFQALKMTRTIIATDSSGTSTTTLEEWFAPGVGLVKMIASTNDMFPGQTTVTQTRELTSSSVVAPASRQLSVSISGTGTVTSNPGGINCINGSQTGCSAAFSDGSTVVLTASPPWYSMVGWGNCTVDANDGKICSAAMNTDKTVSTTFSVIQDPVLIPWERGYDTLLAASLAVSKDCTIMARDTYASALSETLVFNNGYNVTLSGGMDANWNTTGGYSTIKGKLTIRSGRVTAKSVRIRS